MCVRVSMVYSGYHYVCVCVRVRVWFIVSMGVYLSIYVCVCVECVVGFAE